MSAKKVGALIRVARTNAGMTQEQLARKVKNASASDIGRAERGEKELTQEQLKAIAKATGVTQKSLLDAAKGTTTTKKTASGSKTTGSSKKTSGSKTSMQVTASEKRLVELYRKATTDEKKKAVAVLRGEQSDFQDLFEDILEHVVPELLGGGSILKR